MRLLPRHDHPAGHARVPALTSPAGHDFSLRRIGRSTALLTVAGLIGQVAALLRELYVASRVGASASLDALLVAIVLPVLLSGIIAGSLRTAIVPAYFEVLAAAGPATARRFVGAVMTWTTVAAIGATVILAATPSVGLALTGPGLSDSARIEAIDFVPLLLPILVLAVLTNLLAALCQIGDRFIAIAVSLIAAPVISLVVTVVGWDRLGLSAVAVGMSAGYLATVASLALFAGRAGLLPPIAVSVHREHVGRFLGHAVPLTLGSAVLQFNLVADRSIASLLSAGAVSMLKFGQQLVTEPLGSVASAWTTALYPALVRTGQTASDTSLGAASTRALRYGVAMFIPLSFGIAALAPLLVAVVYVRGAFNAAAALGTSQVVVGFAPMLALVMLRPIVTGAHNTRRHGTLLGTTAVANAVSNLVLNLLFARWFGVGGVAFSTSVTTGIILVILTQRLAATEADFDTASISRVAARSIVASAIPSVVVTWIAWNLAPSAGSLGALLLLVGLGLAGAVAYVAIADLLAVDEVRELRRSVVVRALRGRSVRSTRDLS